MNLQKRSFILLTLTKWVELGYQLAVVVLMIISAFQTPDDLYSGFRNKPRSYIIVLKMVVCAFYTLSVYYSNLFFNLRFKLFKKKCRNEICDLERDCKEKFFTD